MNIKCYPWLYLHFEQLTSLYHEKIKQPVLLIQATPGIGDETLIYAVMRFLMCQHPEDRKICGNCHGCQLMQAGTHPDYYKLSNENEKSIIGIDLVREVSEKLYECAQLNGAKIVWITDTTLLTESAVNALLKIIEDPPEKTCFFLSCREPKSLPATLRSRCLLYRLIVPKESYALAWLKRKIIISQEKALTALRLCGGAPVAALSLLEPIIYSQREDLCIALKTAIDNHNWLSLLDVLNHSQVQERLHWLSSLLLDALKIQQGTTIINNIDNITLVNILASRILNTSLFAIIHDTFNCRERLLTMTGVNRELILTNYLLSIEHYIQSSGELSISHIWERI